MKKKTIILSGPTSVMKTSALQSYFRTMLRAKTLGKLKKCDFRACDCILLDDFDMSTLKDVGRVFETALSFLCRCGNERGCLISALATHRPKSHVNVRRIITTNCIDLEVFVKIAFTPEHWPAIESRVEWIDLQRRECRPGIPNARISCRRWTRMHLPLTSHLTRACASTLGPVLASGASGHRIPPPERASA